MQTSYNYNSLVGAAGWANRVIGAWYPSGTYGWTSGNRSTLANPVYGSGIPNWTGYGQTLTIGASSLMLPDPGFNTKTENSIQVLHYKSDQATIKLEQRAMASDKGSTLTWVLSYAWAKGFNEGGRPYGDYPASLAADFTSQSWYKAGMGASVPIVAAVDKGGLLPRDWTIDTGLKAHNISFSGVYDLPFGKGKKYANTNWFAKTVIGDWKFDWIVDYVSGNYSYGYPGVYNFCGNYYAVRQDENHWFNNDKTCYGPYPANAQSGLLYEQTPAYGVIPRYVGNLPQLKDPQKPQTNIAIEKIFTVTERYKFSIRGESFNVTNTPIRNGMQSTSYTSSVFGMLYKTQKNWPRFAQVSAKFYF